MKTTSLKSLHIKLKSEELLLQKGYERLLCLGELDFEPKPWQTETALKALRDMQGSALLADEVGLGKTVEAGLIIKELLHRGLIRSILVLVPSPLVEQWKVEMRDKFSIELFDMKDKGWEKEPLLISSIHFPLRKKDRREKILDKTFDLVIVDEAHVLKNHKTSIYKFVYQLKRKNTLLLSATPLQNDMKEIFNLINIMKPGYLKSRKQFKKEYMQDRFTPKNVRKLKQLLNDVMIRHRRANTLTELPRRTLKNLEIRTSDVERAFQNEIIEFCKFLHTNYDKKTMALITLILLLKENTSTPQAVVSTLKKSILPRVLEEDKKRCLDLIELGESIDVSTKMETLLKSLQRDSEQAIIYSEFQVSIDNIKKYLESNGISVITYSGRLRPVEKDKAIKDFKEGSAQVFLSTEAGGQGLI